MVEVHNAQKVYPSRETDEKLATVYCAFSSKMSTKNNDHYRTSSFQKSKLVERRQCLTATMKF